jgi:hypothetical protein
MNDSLNPIGTSGPTGPLPIVGTAGPTNGYRETHKESLWS